MSTYILIYAWDVTGSKHKKVVTAIAFGKGKWETGRKDGKEICLSSYTVFNLLVSCTLYIYYPVKSYIKKKKKTPILKGSSFQITWRMLTDTTISPQGLFLKPMVQSVDI